MASREALINSYKVHTSQLIEGLTFFGQNYMEEDKLYLSATYSYAYWLLCQSIELIDEGERIYEMISTSLMYDFKGEIEVMRTDYNKAYSSLKYSLFEEIDLDENRLPNPAIDESLLSLLEKYIGEEYSHSEHSFADAYQVLSHSREKLHNAGVFIYRLLECTLGMIKTQFGRYRRLRNRTDDEFFRLWHNVIDNYKKSDLYRKDLEGYLSLISLKLNESDTDEGKLNLYKEYYYKTIEDIQHIPELGDIWRRSSDNQRDLACNLIRNECKEEYLYNRFISLVCYLGYLECEIVELQNELKPQETKVKVVKEKKKKGNKKTVIFIDKIDELKLANSIKAIYDCYYSVSGQRIEISEHLYNPIDFLVAIYFVLVKLELSASTRNNVNRQYCIFLNEIAGIIPSINERTMGLRFAKVVASSNDFHNLTEEMIDKYKKSGGFSMAEFPLWQQMVSIAEEVLKEDDYITGVLKKLNN